MSCEARLPCWEQGALSAKDVHCCLQVLSAGALKSKIKFNRGNSQGGAKSTHQESGGGRVFRHPSGSTIRKNENATSDCKEQHGVNSTKRENNTNCLPVVN